MELNCPKLREASTEIWGLTSFGPSYISLRFDETLSISAYGDRPVLPLEALSMPSLKSISFQKRFTISSVFQTVEPPSAIEDRIGALPLRSMNFSALEDEELTLIKYLNLKNVEQFHLDDMGGDYGSNFPVLSMPQLRHLTLEGRSLRSLSFILDHLDTGHCLTTLALGTMYRIRDILFRKSPLESPSPSALPLSRHDALGVTTLILNCTNGGDTQGEDIFLQRCVNVTSLILKHAHIGTFEHNLSKIDPKSPFNSAWDSSKILPVLQHITFEFSTATVDDILNAWSDLVKVIGEVDAHRQASGFVPLLSITFSVLVEFEIPEVVELEPESKSRIIYNIRMANEKQQLSVLVTGS